ncbi:MAG: hypothetical protein GF355_07025 [Candidatus Eisenbacteria bacterium]|nr:hypothetical protein [Candidatus Eisenbacteria bacterium]
MRHLAALQKAVRAALSPEEIAAVIRALRDRAIEGDVQAARVLLDRILGRPGPEQPAEDGNGSRDVVGLGRLATADDAAEAIGAVLAAAGSGRITPPEAMQLAGVIETARRVIETQQLEGRLARLESELKENSHEDP